MTSSKSKGQISKEHHFGVMASTNEFWGIWSITQSKIYSLELDHLTFRNRNNIGVLRI
jgi:hypothetical protein